MTTATGTSNRRRTGAAAYRASDGYDVRVSDPRSWVLQIQGPSSFHVMRGLTDGAVDETMKYFHSGYFRIGGLNQVEPAGPESWATRSTPTAPPPITPHSGPT